MSSKLNLLAQLLASYVSIRLYAAAALKSEEDTIVEFPCVQEPGPAGSAVTPRQSNGAETKSDLRDMSGRYSYPSNQKCRKCNQTDDIKKPQFSKTGLIYPTYTFTNLLITHPNPPYTCPTPTTTSSQTHPGLLGCSTRPCPTDMYVESRKDKVHSVTSATSTPSQSPPADWSKDLKLGNQSPAPLQHPST